MEIQKKISRLLVDTAKCLYENAKRWPEKQYDSTSKFGSSEEPDEKIQVRMYSGYSFYDDYGFIYEDPEERKELLKESFLYSVYNRSVKNTMTAMYWMRVNHKPHTIAKLYSPFEHCPVPILEQLCDVYPSVIEELKQIPPFVPERFPNQRKSQDEYLGKIREPLTKCSTHVYKICETYKDEQKPNLKYKDEFQILELVANQVMIDHLYPLLQYSTRSMEFYNGQTPYGMGYGPSDHYYWNWRDNIAELYIEAIECHWNMLRQLIPMRKELEAIAQKRQEEEKAIKHLQNNLGNNFGLDRLFHIRKSKPKPKRNSSMKRVPSPKHNSPPKDSSPRQNSSMKQVPRISIESNRMRGPSPNRSRRPSASMKRPQVKRSNGLGFGKSFQRPVRLPPPIRSRKRVNSLNQPGTEKNVLNLEEKYTRNHRGTIKKNNVLTVENI